MQRKKSADKSANKVNEHIIESCGVTDLRYEGWGTEETFTKSGTVDKSSD